MNAKRLYIISGKVSVLRALIVVFILTRGLVHSAQSRVSRDPVDIRCRQLFWRVWSSRRLSVHLSQDVILQLWMRCQRTYDLSPFTLQITNSASSDYRCKDESPPGRQERPSSAGSQTSDAADSISPSQVPTVQGPLDKDAQEGSRSEKHRQKPKLASKTSESRPAILTRTSSGGEAQRKRSTGSITTVKTKARPPITRKRSSQATQGSDTGKPRRSIMKSPRTSLEDESFTHFTQPPPINFAGKILASPGNDHDLRQRKISDFALTSASSWQSVESYVPRENTSTQMGTSNSNKPLIDGNFRERFVETQKILKSSTNLDSMNRNLRKSGSVVRFADDVDGPAEIRRLKAVNKQKDADLRSPPLSTLRTVSEGQSSQLPSQSQIESWRPANLQRHDSVGSVAAVSEDSETEDEESMMMLLPRTRSQLSLGIANLKRSRSQGEQSGNVEQEVAITSPEVELEQDALIFGRAGKKRDEEEEKLLAMGRKDGVTRAGGVNLPKELTVKGPRDPSDTFEEPELALF